MTASPEAEQQTPGPIPRSRTPFSLGFRQPEPEPELPPSLTIPSPASSPDSPAAAAPASEPDDESEPWSESPDDTRSTASSTKTANPLVGNALRDTFRSGVIIASAQAHNYLARTELQRDAQLYLASDADAANIGDPLSRIAARRDGLGQVSPDTADLMSALMGLAGYASRQIQLTASLRAHEARAAAAEQLPTDL